MVNTDKPPRQLTIYVLLHAITKEITVTAIKPTNSILTTNKIVQCLTITEAPEHKPTPIKESKRIVDALTEGGFKVYKPSKDDCKKIDNLFELVTRSLRFYVPETTYSYKHGSDESRTPSKTWPLVVGNLHNTKPELVSNRLPNGSGNKLHLYIDWKQRKVSFQINRSTKTTEGIFHAFTYEFANTEELEEAISEMKLGFGSTKGISVSELSFNQLNTILQQSKNAKKGNLFDLTELVKR